MPNINFVLLYVDSTPVSAKFYTEALGKPPVENSETFAMFAMPSGLMLGLWSKHTCKPAPSAEPGASEIAFTVATADEVRTTHAEWLKRGYPIKQAPVELDFGTTCVALDPDGHRLRVFAPARR